MKKIKQPLPKTKGSRAVHPAEIVWYTLCGLVMLWGLTYIVLGLVAANLPIKSTDEGLVKANADFANIFGLDFLGWGLIILAIGAVCAVIVLLATASKSDRDYEKQTRRAQRLAQLEAEEEKEEQNENQQGEIVDAKVEEPAKEEKSDSESPKEE